MGSRPKNNNSGVDAETRRRQMELEQQRLKLEQDAAVQRQQELELLGQQTQVQTQAYQAQTNLLQNQAAEMKQRQDEFAGLLSNLTNVQSQQQALSVYEKAKQKLLDQEQSQQLAGQTGLLSNQRQQRGVLRDKKRGQSAKTFTQSERRTLLSSSAPR